MTTTRFATVLLAFGLALAAILSVQPANAALAGPDYGPPPTDPNGAVYCVSAYITGQFPDCVPPPTPSKTYKGQPISVDDAKNIPWGTMRTSVNVLRNDAIEKRSKSRVEVVYPRPKVTGLHLWVRDNKIWFEMQSGQHLGFLSGGLAFVQYRVVDAKGRGSYPVSVKLKVT